MTAVLPIQKAEPATAAGWREHTAMLAALAAAILLLFRRDAADIAGIWYQSSTFNHCLLIVPLIGWLVWQRWPELRQLAPAAWAPGLLLVAAGAVAWLLGEAGGLALARHAGLGLMLEGAVVACLGRAVARGLLFPLCYALFLIPAGEELVPPMQTLTAKMSMALLGLFHVPARIEGIFITTPTGLFQVAEACSGVKFLVAMAAYGALAANLCFRSWRRRAAFFAGALIVPIFANGIRAWGTIYIAYRANSLKFAASFDHVFYGWIFFAIVIAIVMGAAWPFFDRKANDPWFDPADLQSPGTLPGPRRRLGLVAFAAVATAAAAPLWSAAVASTGTAPVPAGIATPPVPGWREVPAEAGRAWAPHFAGADRIASGRYRDAAGRDVDLWLVVYARQEGARKLIGFGQGAAEPGGAWAWTTGAPPPPGGKSERIFSNGIVREVASFYRVGGIVTGSPAQVKLETMKVHLVGGPQRAVAVLVSAVERAGPGSARPAIDAFLRALGPIHRLADRAAGVEGAR
ncbi:MAG: exosortase A [Alphaproteobacteria bacterium]|nr:exosortase A [Alphaproteobacteria bacterium]